MNHQNLKKKPLHEGIIFVFLIVGLGNPGKRYHETRHNIGFMILDRLAAQTGNHFKKGKGPYDFLKTRIHDYQVLLAKPLTFMNRSGIAVDDLMKRYPIPISKLLIVCDDISLPLGKLRLRKTGSDGGHRGLASIISYLRLETFSRLKVGVGSDEQGNTVNYVLSKFYRNERKFVKAIIEQSNLAITDFIQNGIDWTMNQYNG